tara:strand:- start:80032 stop:80166 length:135 start_codon:yes stop_codon:yes gene_type:complete
MYFIELKADLKKANLYLMNCFALFYQLGWNIGIKLKLEDIIFLR